MGAMLFRYQINDNDATGVVWGKSSRIAIEKVQRAYEKYNFPSHIFDKTKDNVRVWFDKDTKLNHSDVIPFVKEETE